MSTILQDPMHSRFGKEFSLDRCTPKNDGFKFFPPAPQKRFDDWFDYVVNPRQTKLTRGIHSIDRERERRVHQMDRIQFEMTGRTELASHWGNAYPIVNTIHYALY
jgi:hypothetical protein